MITEAQGVKASVSVLINAAPHAAPPVRPAPRAAAQAIQLWRAR
jgi:hypothetical protein